MDLLSDLYGAGTQPLLAHNSVCATHSLSAARWTDSLRCLECNKQSLTMSLSTLLHYRIKSDGRSCFAHQCAHSRSIYTTPARLPSYSHHRKAHNNLNFTNLDAILQSNRDIPYR